MAPNKKSAAKPDDLRRAVLDASAKLISTEGLAALSLRRVAKEAGVSHQAPYHHFANREAILAALAQEGFVALSAATRQFILSRTPRAQLRAAVRGYVGFALEHPAHFRLMFRPELVDLKQHPEALAAAVDAYNALVEFADGLRQGRGRGALATQALADTLWSTCHGAACILLDGVHPGALPDRQESFIQRVAETLAKLIEPGLS